MILVDTSIWVDHLRRSNATLVNLLTRGQVLMHPFIIGELALGDLDPREIILDDLRGLPKASAVSDGEIMTFIHQQKLFNSGIGYVDAHLLAATRLTPDAGLWTRDKKLAAAAARLSLAANPHVWHQPAATSGGSSRTGR